MIQSNKWFIWKQFSSYFLTLFTEHTNFTISKEWESQYWDTAVRWIPENFVVVHDLFESWAVIFKHEKNQGRVNIHVQLQMICKFAINSIFFHFSMFIRFYVDALFM